MTALIIFSIFAISTFYIHRRGALKHKFQRQLLDHSTFFAPINCLMYASSKVENTPYIKQEHFPELQLLKDNWQLIRDEALALTDQDLIKKSDKYNDAGFNSFFRQGWKRFYLKWYDKPLSSSLKYCPETVKLLNQIPYIKGAMFASLPADSELKKHRDPYAGSLRYHLGLTTPNSDECSIFVDGQQYSWRDGEAVIFDETYIHYAKNRSDSNRIILFCDIERPTNNFFARWVNKFFSMTMARSSASPNTADDKTGLLNRIFGLVYPIRVLGKRLKAFNSNIYYLVKYALLALVLYAIIF